MFFGYNTNGLAHHDLFDAVELLADTGYRGVAITIDHHALSPRDPRHRQQRARLRELLEARAMRSVIETGARFLLNPREKHEPTLLSESPRQRIDFYKYAIDCASELASDCVSLWSGKKGSGKKGSELFFPGADGAGSAGAVAENSSDPFFVLAARLGEVLDYAAAQGVKVALEPEPGMFIHTTQAFEALLDHMAHPNLWLTLDIGHLQCQREFPMVGVIRRWASRLINVHLEDMRAGKHEHLMFGEGEIDFPPVLRALAEVGYAQGVYVELSRHSHEGPAAAKRALEWLKNLCDTTG